MPSATQLLTLKVSDVRRRVGRLLQASDVTAERRMSRRAATAQRARAETACYLPAPVARSSVKDVPSRTAITTSRVASTTASGLPSWM